jgi:hypothetical protein
MGYRKTPTIYQLTFADPDYEGLEVRCKALKLGRLRKLLAVTGKGDMSNEELDELFGILEEGLLSWNLEDEDGNPVPTTREGINDQEVPFILDIVDTWIDGMTGVGEDLGKGSSSGETFPVALPTMEAL